MRCALILALLLAAAAHAAAPAQVFIHSYRGKAGKHFHKTGCEQLQGVIKSISLETALATLESCPHCFAEPPAAAVPTDAPSDEKLANLLEVSGVKASLEQLPVALASAGSQPDAQGNAPRPEITAALTEAFRAPLLIASATRQLKLKLKTPAIDGAIALMKDPLVAKFTQLEREASGAEAAKALPDFLKELTEKPPSTLRRGAIERLDQLYALTELQLDIVMASALALPRAMARKDVRNRGAMQKIEDQSVELRNQLRPKFRDLAQGGLYFAYRAVTDEELTKYVQTLEGSPDKMAVGEALRDAMKTAIEQAADRAGEKLLLSLPQVAPAPSPPPE